MQAFCRTGYQPKVDFLAVGIGRNLSGNAIPCGSELARDEGVSVDTSVGCHTAIASKLAPTGNCAKPRISR
ncbi:hypothetical protein EMIT0196MI5_210042 [Pseudomonas sp. IT-196MI5]